MDRKRAIGGVVLTIVTVGFLLGACSSNESDANTATAPSSESSSAAQ